MPFEIPESWVWTTVDELLINRDSERIPLSSAVRKKQFNKVYDYYGAAGAIDKVEGYLFNERLLLIGEDGANLLSRSKDNAFFADGKYWVNNHAHVLDCCCKPILIYVSYLINSMSLEPFVTGTAQPKLSQDNLNKIPIPLPPFKEQGRIVSEIEKCFSTIDQIDNNMADLESYIKKVKLHILDLAISGKLVPQDHADEPAIELLKRINPSFKPCDNSHYEKLPNGWCVCRLEDICQICDNKRQPINSSERLERKKNTSNLYPYYGATGQVDWIDDYMLDGTFILLGEDGAPFLDKNADKAYIVSGKFWVNNHAHILYPRCDVSYLTHYLNRYDYSECVNGSTRLKLTQADMKNIDIFLPPLNEQLRISQTIRNIFDSIDAIAAELQ